LFTVAIGHLSFEARNLIHPHITPLTNLHVFVVCNISSSHGWIKTYEYQVFVSADKLRNKHKLFQRDACTWKDIFTQIYSLWSFTYASSGDMEESIKNIWVAIMEPNPVSKQPWTTKTQLCRKKKAITWCEENVHFDTHEQTWKIQNQSLFKKYRKKYQIKVFPF